MNDEEKINQKEQVALPFVTCSTCGNLTQQGLHQVRLNLVKKGYFMEENGNKTYIRPVMKRIDLYMCLNCVSDQKKWPGQKP